LGGESFVHFFKEDTGLMALVFNIAFSDDQDASSVDLAIFVLTSIEP
jgi:hypothetical protein